MQNDENLVNSQDENSQKEPINGFTITESSVEYAQTSKFDFSKIFKFIKNYELSKHLLLMIVLAFIFSVGLRIYWIYWASGYPQFFWNDQLMINTNDGYAFAEGARDYLAGFHQPNDLSYIDFPLAKLTAWLKMILPFSFESIILYLPMILSSLIVVPILLISAEFKCLRAGFIGALVACVAHSYYNRTMSGYYDTDMLNIVFAMFVLWGLVRICTKGDRLSLILTPIFIGIYLWWYPSSFTLNSAFLGIFIVYSLIFQRKRVINYEAIILLFLSITWISLFLKFGLIFALFFFFIYKKELVNWRILGIIGVLVLALFIIKGGLNPIWFNLRFYIFRDIADNAHNASAIFHYFNVNQTIQESGIVPPKIFMERISSHTIVFVIALFGYALLCFKHKEFLLSLPLLALGFLANKAGLRFTIYAVGVMGLSFGYILYFGIKNLNMPKFLQRILLFSATLAALYPAWTHIRDYKSDTVFFRSEVEILDKLKNIAGREDYVLAWWDYGYPIRYYSDTKTLIDGGKHLGDDNFPVSFSLFKDQVSSANMARLAVEYTERKFQERFNGDLMQKAIKDYGVSDINDFLLSLRFNDFTPPKASRDVYFYLPDRMNNIFPVIMQFSNLDLKTGQKFVDPLYYSGGFFGKNEYGVNIGSGIMLRNDLLVAKIGGKEYSINTFYETSYDSSGKLVVKEIAIDSSGGLYIIFMKDYGRFILLDNTTLNSTYIQLFVLERYDSELFEPVILNPAAKIYKLKR